MIFGPAQGIHVSDNDQKPIKTCELLLKLSQKRLEASPIGFGGILILATSDVIVRRSNLPRAIMSIGPKLSASFLPNLPVQPSTMIRSVIWHTYRRVSLLVTVAFL